MKTAMSWACRSLLLSLALVSTFLTCTRADYVEKSILCDDIPSICEENKLEYEADNHTLCGTQDRYLNPQICNCGYKCMGTIEKDESCPKAVSFFFPEEVCGNSLECLSEEVAQTDAYCLYNMDMECIEGSVNYDAALASGGVGPGQLRPNCKDDGDYAGRQCSPGSTCYCVDEKNRRLFGEGPTTTAEEITCGCAIYWQETEARGLQQGLRCLPNGNFDPLYCEGEICYCYDAGQKIINGTYLYSMLTNIPCYDSKIHNANYSNLCTRDQEAWDSLEGNTTIVIAQRKRPNCTRDGYYGPIQAIGPNVYCVDPFGEVIENFTMPLHLSDKMTCNCARRRYVMENNMLSASKPKCCSDGSFYAYQTRGLLAYCVDENGNQWGEEQPITNIEALLCYSRKPCPSW